MKNASSAHEDSTDDTAPADGSSNNQASSHSRNRARGIIAVIAVIIPLAIGAVVTALSSLGPEDTWTFDQEPAAAPSTSNPAGIPSSELVDARRAAGEASSQAGLLQSAVDELITEVQGFGEESGQLEGAVAEASQGSQKLRQGLVELQAATGQLGSGASEVADGVGTAVDHVVGFGVVQGQIIDATNMAIEQLREVDDPSAEDAIADLESLRQQVKNFDFEQEITDDLVALKDGSRDIANQLNVPGYGFHDGVYELTEGSKQLATGLGELHTSVSGATDGLDEFDGGIEQIETMVGNNKDKVDAVNRTLPVAQVADDTGDDERHAMLSPIIALLISALVMMAGAAMAMTAWMRVARAWLIYVIGAIAVAGTGAILLAVLGDSIAISALALAAALCALAALAAAGLTQTIVSLLGPRAGLSVVAVAAIAQLGLIGWVWQAAVTAPVSSVWQAIAALFPLHWSTTVLSTLGNGGDELGAWVGAGVLLAVALIGLLATPKWVSRTRASLDS